MKRFKQKMSGMLLHSKVAALSILLISITAVTHAQNLAWVKSMGGKTDNKIGGELMAIDYSGNVYITGQLTDTIDPGSGLADLYPDPEANSQSIFISKLDSAGNHVWAKRFSAKTTSPPGTNNPLKGKLEVSSIITDPTGNVLIGGSFRGISDFGSGSSIPNITAFADDGSHDLFIFKINTTGDLVWAKNIGTSKLLMNSITIASDASGNIYTTSDFQGNATDRTSPTIVDFNPGSGTAFLTAEYGNKTLCFLKLDADGNFVYAKEIQNLNRFAGVSKLAVDSTGNLYSVGYFQGTTDFDPGSGTTYLTSSNMGSGTNNFLLKLDADGNFVWVKEPTGYGITSLTIDASGNIISLGFIKARTDFDWGPDSAFLAPEPNELNASVIAKHDSSGSYVWAKSLHGEGFSGLSAITSDASNNIYSMGWFMGQVSVGTTTLNNGGGNIDLYLTKQDSIGNFVWAKRIGGSGKEGPIHVLVDTLDNIYFSGMFEETVNFDPGNDTFNLTSRGGTDIFVMKWAQPTCNTFENISATACDSFIFNGQSYTASGSYTQIIPNTVECDSVITLQLTINSTPEQSVERSGNTFTAAVADTWQWIDCDNHSIITGADQQSFTPIVNGSYAVVVTGTGGCSDTSDCYTVTDIVGISAGNRNDNMTLYPNPANDVVKLITSNTLQNATINITNVIGQQLKTITNLHGNLVPFDVSSYPAGIYIIEVAEGNKRSRIKFVKE